MHRALTVTAFTLIGLLEARTAAATPIGSVSASAFGLYGHELAEEYFEDPHGLGLELRLGIALPVPVYLGVSYSHFFGSDQHEVLFSAPPIFVTREASLSQLLGHVGYEFDLVFVVLRPNLGIGYAHTRAETHSWGERVEEMRADLSSDDWVVSPGFDASVPLGPLSACAQLRYDIIPADPEDREVLVAGVGVGVRF